MLERERPDILHVVTHPGLRVPLMTLASECEAPLAIVEKPLALDSADYRAIEALSRTTRTEFVVDHQLRFHPKVRELVRDVAEGQIGAVRHVHASARALLAEQGTHVTDLLFAFLGDRPPVSVFGAVSGAGRMDDTHPAPEMAEATLVLGEGQRATLECGTNAPHAVGTPSSIYMHKRIAVHGAHGFVEWQMNAWEQFTPEGGHEQGAYQYAEGFFSARPPSPRPPATGSRTTRPSTPTT